MTIAILATSTVFAANHELELRGQISGADSRPLAPVTVFGVQTSYKDSVPVSSSGEFRFRSLAPGDYTIAVVGEGSAEVRRTVVVSAALADRDGVVHTTIPFVPNDTSVNGSGTVSVRQLLTSRTASTWYADAQKRLAQHDAAGATHDLQQALRVDPEYSEAWNAMGVISAQNGNDADAEKYFRKALESEPGAFEPSINLGHSA